MDGPELALPPRQKRSRRSVEQAIEGAIDVISDSGWEGFTMAAVSRRASVSVPLLHRRFGGKEDLFLAAQAAVLQRIEEDAEQFFGGDRWEGLSARETIELATLGIAEILSRYGRLLRGFHDRGVIDPRVRARAVATVAYKHRLFSARILGFAAELEPEGPEVGVTVCFVSVVATFNEVQKDNNGRSDPPGWDRLVAEVARASSAYLLGGTVTTVKALSERRRRRISGQLPADTPRERLLVAGIELLAEQGYAGLTAVGVGDRAGTSVAALYNVFTNKNELVVAVEMLALDRLLRDAESIFAPLQVAGGDLEHRTSAATRALVRLIEANPAATRVLMHRRTGADAIAYRNQGVLDLLRAWFRGVIVADDVQRPDPELAANVCFLMLYSVLTSVVPHAEYMTATVSAQRFHEGQVRMCQTYLRASADSLG